ncbi:hypothetical protein BG011_008244 [Mortierella polycephala]|uniref:ubiquitinyl hydrolase 1 n=1 Tax=Mortierella polycephala TaxID=41804 RepID=A0A9P6PRI6_9FUNG|nr:hypothetical protein BG011_008244 [Mortierella polycephala]
MSLPTSSILSGASPFGQDGGGAQRSRSKERRPSGPMDVERQVLRLQVTTYFEHVGYPADEEIAEYLLSSYQWDIGKTMQYCEDLVQAVQGALVPVQTEIPLNGAVNDQMTSCYIDALLFAMFARLSAFEGLLNVNLDVETDSDSDGSSEMAESRRSEARQGALLHSHRLQTWLRMFVNQLRSGRLIQAHVVKELRQHLYSCGWHCPGPHDPPGMSRQEDSSELFMFLTEKLQLPYLPLEQRLLHGAKISADDDKVITERMLQISIPTPPALEPANPAKNSKKSKGPDVNRAGSSAYETLSLEKLLAEHFYDNTLTGIRRVVSSGTGAPLSPGVEVPVSAWQVLELLPFYSSSNEQGGIISASQSQYPTDVVILPLILKRYSIGPGMQARRIGTPINIPRHIDFSRFVNPQSPGSFATQGIDTNITATAPLSESASLLAYPPSSSSPSSSSQIVAQSDSVPPLMKINTQTPPDRKYSMSLLHTMDSPKTPVTPPPQYTPGQGKQFQEMSDDKKGWSSVADEHFGRGYVNYSPPKVKYMLELKSVVCHVGSSLDSGHYRSYVADTVTKTAMGGSGDSSHPLTFQEPNWLRHDDLDPSGKRVQLMPRDSEANTDMESDWARNGYILFYELQTIPC